MTSDPKKTFDPVQCSFMLCTSTFGQVTHQDIISRGSGTPVQKKTRLLIQTNKGQDALSMKGLPAVQSTNVELDWSGTGSLISDQAATKDDGEKHLFTLFFLIVLVTPIAR